MVGLGGSKTSDGGGPAVIDATGADIWNPVGTWSKFLDFWFKPLEPGGLSDLTDRGCKVFGVNVALRWLLQIHPVHLTSFAVAAIINF